MEASVAATLNAIGANVRKGDFHLASAQLTALTRLLGEERPPMAAFARALATDEARSEIAIARDFYAALGGYQRHRRARNRMQSVAKRSKGYYSTLAAKALAAAGPLPQQPKWKTVVPAPGQDAQTCRYQQWDGDKMPSQLDGWYRADFDDSAWPAGAAPFHARRGRGKATAWSKRHIVIRTAFRLARTDTSQLGLLMSCEPGTQVYLNGFRIVDMAESPRRPDAPVPLRRKAAELLRKGGNQLAVLSHKGRSGTLGITLRAATGAAK